MIKKLGLLIALVCAFVVTTALGQVSGTNEPVIVRPGAPGQPTLRLPPDTRAQLPPGSVKDVEFMQGMIMHHAQAVEMTALIEERTGNKDIRLLGARISQSQEDEMAFMRRWLMARGQSVSIGGNTAQGHGHTVKKDGQSMTMPGMLSPEQMDELKRARGDEFDRLFLKGMIQHHEGALTMVKDLFDTAGTGQDAELFNFASDVDSGQRAEIKTMETLLSKKP